jgi:peptidoglycan hydrolase CwlO-like protein
MDFYVSISVGIITIAGAIISVFVGFIKFRDEVKDKADKEVVNSIEKRLTALEYKTTSIEEKINGLDKKLDTLIAKMDSSREDYHRLNERVAKIETHLEMNPPPATV